MPDIQSLNKDVRKFPFQRSDDGAVATLSIDLDSMTEKYYRGVGERQAARLRAEANEVAPTIESVTAGDDAAQAEDKPFDSEAAAKFIEKFFERAAKNIAEQKRLRADMLSHGVLVDWDLTSADQPLPCTEENLLEFFTLRCLEEIWAFCLAKCTTVQRDNRNEEDKENPERKGSFA